ncbi:hypothetical protein D0Z03_001563 [Geotrichum reessii]|nr:hypothetical protein D0Z03_001563 [Galactomyces reessii]
MSKLINLAIIGPGLVGSAYIRQLSAIKSKAISYSVILIARSSKALVSRDYSPLSLQSWEADLDASTDKLSEPADILNFLKQSPNPVILVDNTSNETLAKAYPSFVENGISIATPNKKAFSDDISLWDQIFDASAKPGAGLVYHEATVGAGLPIIGTLNDLVNTGDEIQKVEGIFSGSLSFIFNNYSTVQGSDLKFSDIVLKAKDLGYTEPDPRDDLNGLDVARKVTIVSRLAGYKVKNASSSFPVESLIPKPLESVNSAAEYIQRLPDFDGELDKLRKEAEAENKVLRFVGSADLTGTPKVQVSIQK